MFEDTLDTATTETDDTGELDELLMSDSDDPEEGSTEEGAPEGEQPEGDTQAQDQPHQPDGEAKVKVNYMGQEIELSMQDLVSSAQKGLDYDRVRGQLENLRSSREISLIDRFAKESGLTREQYLDMLEQQAQARQVQEQVAKGIPEEVAQRLVRLEQEANQRRQQEIQQRQEAAKRQQYVDLAREYPDIKEFPPEVIQAVSNGETPLSAYRAWENKQLKNQLKMAGQQKAARAKSPGSATGELPADDADAFLAGFNSD